MAQTLEMMWDPLTSSGTVDISWIRAVYDGPTVVRDALIWTGMSSTTTNFSGIFTVNLTSDGSTTGPALFSDIFSVSATNLANTNAANALFAALRPLPADLKVATLLGVGTLGFTAPQGRAFQVTVIGVAA